MVIISGEEPVDVRRKKQTGGMTEGCAEKKESAFGLLSSRVVEPELTGPSNGLMDGMIPPEARDCVCHFARKRFCLELNGERENYSPS
jgi:hypothetical protein